MQSGRHHKVWKSVGYIFAACVAILLAAFTILAHTSTLNAGMYSVTLDGGNNTWSMILVAAAYFGIYTLWRNARTIGQNNPFPLQRDFSVYHHRCHLHRLRGRTAGHGKHSYGCGCCSL